MIDRYSSSIHFCVHLFYLFPICIIIEPRKSVFCNFEYRCYWILDASCSSGFYPIGSHVFQFFIPFCIMEIRVHIIQNLLKSFLICFTCICCLSDSERVTKVTYGSKPSVPHIVCFKHLEKIINGLGILGYIIINIIIRRHILR